MSNKRVPAALVRLTGLILTAVAVASPRPLEAQIEHREQLNDKLRVELDAIARETPGVMGIAVLDLTTGESAGVNRDLVFPQGSSIKIPILLELYRQAELGTLRLEERITVRRAQMVGGSGVLQAFGDGTSEVSLRDLAVLMIVLSDNTATNLLIDRIGMDSVTRSMERLGAPQTRLQRVMIRPRDSAAGRENLSTPEEAARLMARIHSCELPVSREHCDELRSILEIPKGGALPDPIPGGIPVAWKPGGITGVQAAWGLVALPGRPYAIAAMVNYSDDAAARDAIRQASAAAYSHFRRLAGATPFGTRVPPELVNPLDPDGR